LAEKNDRPNDREKLLKTLAKGFEHEDEHGSLKIHKKDMKLMSVNKGDVLAVRRVTGLTQDNVDWLAEALSNIGLDGCIIVVVEKTSDIKALDEHIMNQYGWYRLSKDSNEQES
jgi:hypothetical protein